MRTLWYRLTGPSCFGSDPCPAQQAENYCFGCAYNELCLKGKDKIMPEEPAMSKLKFYGRITHPEKTHLPTIHVDNQGIQVGDTEFDMVAPHVEWEDLNDFLDMVARARDFRTKLEQAAS